MPTPPTYDEAWISADELHASMMEWLKDSLSRNPLLTQEEKDKAVARFAEEVRSPLTKEDHERLRQAAADYELRVIGLTLESYSE